MDNVTQQINTVFKNYEKGVSSVETMCSGNEGLGDTFNKIKAYFGDTVALTKTVKTNFDKTSTSCINKLNTIKNLISKLESDKIKSITIDSIFKSVHINDRVVLFFMYCKAFSKDLAQLRHDYFSMIEKHYGNRSSKNQEYIAETKKMADRIMLFQHTVNASFKMDVLIKYGITPGKSNYDPLKILPHAQTTIFKEDCSGNLDELVQWDLKHIATLLENDRKDIEAISDYCIEEDLHVKKFFNDFFVTISEDRIESNNLIFILRHLEVQLENFKNLLKEILLSVTIVDKNLDTYIEHIKKIK